MPNNLPGSDGIDIRDYLFVDRPRVGSLLAQFIDGLPAERNASSSRSSKVSAGIAKMIAGRESVTSEAQTLALADLHVSQLEESAEALGMLGDVSDKMLRRKFWLRGAVRKQVEPGMLLRVTAPTQVSDVASIIAAFDRLNGVLSDARQADEMSTMLTMLEALYGDSITVAVRTAEGGDDDFEVGFVGEIPHAHEFGPMQRDLLLSQVGPAPADLTTLMQISVVPTERDSTQDYSELFQKIMPTVQKMKSDNGIDRSGLDGFISTLGSVLTTTGFVAAPRWPAIGVIPLAIYRTVLSVPDLD